RDPRIAGLHLLAGEGPVGPAQLLGLLAEAALLRRRGERVVERGRHIVQVDAVLRALRAGKRGLDAREIELEFLRIINFALARNAEQALRLEVLGEAAHGLVGAAGARQVP